MITHGVHGDLSNRDYADAKEYLSVAGLKRHLPDFYKPPPTTGRDALDFGIAFHTTVLGVGEPVVPVDAATWAGKEAKTKREETYATGGIPLLVKDLPKVEAMAEAVRTHPVASALLFGEGRSEVSMFADVDGVECRARFDRITDDGWLIDLKSTTSRPDPHTITRTAIDFGYDLQDDHYRRVADALEVEHRGFLLVLVGKEAPHYVNVVQLDESFHARAARLREIALERMRHPEFTDPYPGASRILSVSAPRWAML